MAIFLKARRRFDLMEGALAEVDRSNYLTRDLAAWIDIQTGRNKIGDGLPVIVGTVPRWIRLSAIPVSGLRVRGFGVNGVGASDKLESSFSAHAVQRTYALWVYAGGIGGSQLGRIFDKRTAAADSQVEQLYQNAATNMGYERLWSGGNAKWAFPLLPGGADSGFAHVVIQYDSSSTANDPLAWYNVISQTPVETFAPSGSVTDNAAKYVLGNRGNDGARNWDGFLGDLLIWNRILSAEEIWADYTDRGQMLRPVRRVVYSIASASAITASSSIVEDDDSVSSSAVVLITANAELLEEEDSIVSSATVSVTATTAIQEEDDTVSASASSATFATTDIQEEDDAVSSSAAVTVTATASIQEEADLVSSSATVSVTATAALVEEDDQVSSAAATGTVAQAAITEEDDSVAAAATVSVTASASISEEDDLISASAATGIVATAEIQEDDDLIAAAATVSGGAVTCSADIIEEGDICVSSVSVLILATADITEDDDTISASVVERIARRIAASDRLKGGIATSDGLN